MPITIQGQTGPRNATDWDQILRDWGRVLTGRGRLLPPICASGSWGAALFEATPSTFLRGTRDTNICMSTPHPQYDKTTFLTKRCHVTIQYVILRRLT